MVDNATFSNKELSNSPPTVSFTPNISTVDSIGGIMAGFIGDDTKYVLNKAIGNIPITVFRDKYLAGNTHLTEMTFKMVKLITLSKKVVTVDGISYNMVSFETLSDTIYIVLDGDTYNKLTDTKYILDVEIVTFTEDFSFNLDTNNLTTPNNTKYYTGDTPTKTVFPPSKGKEFTSSSPPTVKDLFESGNATYTYEEEVVEPSNALFIIGVSVGIISVAMGVSLWYLL